ncbi:MAG TPA: pitrilysin family protein [Acidimicrobiales bacterium]|nr:pitrilysin family protein [Acidimicrobiales bacterium]
MGTAAGITRFTLDNGLRVVVAEDRSAPVVAVTVNYDIGLRTEREGRSGFAHLFEHIMFRGSANVPDGDFSRLTSRYGGGGNASTGLDQTNYTTVLPTNALELGLFVESDRMGWPTLSEEAHRGECEVVKEETRLRFLNKPKTEPIGGWWLDMRALAFDGYPNAHDGTGSFEEIEASSAAETREFFESYYTPANAVLSIVGDPGDVDVKALVEKWFGVIPGRPTSPIPAVSEPPLSEERRKVLIDKLTPSPMLAVGWRTPDPVADMASHAAAIVLAEVLVAKEDGLLVRRLVSKEQLATSVAGFVEFFGLQFLARDPLLLSVTVHHDGSDADALLSAIDEEVAQFVAAPDECAVERAKTTVLTRWLQNIDEVGMRSIFVAGFELIWGRAELLDEIADVYRSVTTDDVVRVARDYLTPTSRAVLDIRGSK